MEGTLVEDESLERPEVPRNAPPEAGSSRTVTTRVRAREQRRQATTDAQARVDDATATSSLHRVGGSRLASAETVIGRPEQTGLRHAGSSGVDLSHSEQIEVISDKAGSSQIEPEPEVEPVDRHKVPDDTVITRR